jgi:hypothetical protein
MPATANRTTQPRASRSSAEHFRSIRLLLFVLAVWMALPGCPSVRADSSTGTYHCLDYRLLEKTDAHYKAKALSKPDSSHCEVVYFDRYADKIWSQANPNGVSGINAQNNPLWTTTIASSKVLLSGSILIVTVDPKSDPCARLDWKVVTQAKESENVLIFGPADYGPGTCNDTEYIIVLPVHVLWAEVTSFHRVDDPTRKAPTAYAPKDPVDCQTRPDLCDSTDWPSSWFYKTRHFYNLATQPGSSQGSISYSPVIGGGPGSPKLTWDLQLASSGQVGPGWLGLPLMFEKDSNRAANLDALLTGVTYDFRSVVVPNFKTTPHFTLRKPQYELRSLVELAPTESSGTRDLNLVEGETIRLPFVFSFNRQPSALTITPILGLEEGSHVETHLVEGDHVLRGLGGGDVNYIWPYNFLHALLGDKPITMNFSYRVRWLAYPEPLTDVANTGPEILSTRTRFYWRAALVEPLSSFLQFKVGVQHGSLPPDFRLLAYSLSIGLTFTNPNSSEY